ncbi:MAG: acetate--CoA ligase [Betaproteobacteria bacterium]|nr:acetate--CoA ligase [Betaproteobacteria bacterium]MDE2622682.1 acetate--CoA ligase [Betaproteobacteria bacterium]
MDRPAVIRKTASDWRVAPHWHDYEAQRADFSWDDVRRELEGLPGGALNIAHEAVDRHARGPRRHHPAFVFLGEQGQRDVLTYAELATLTNRFASALASLGVHRGDTLFVLSGRIPELYIAVLGSLKAGMVVSPLFSAFGPEPVATRLTLGAGRVLVTTESLYQRKVEGLRGHLPQLEHVLLVGEKGRETSLPDTLDFGRFMSCGTDVFDTVPTFPEDAALLHFTSGTTGKPKGAQHVHKAVLMHWMTGKYALDLHPGDIYWCTADPGWVTGTSYGIIAPLLHGITSVIDEGEFDAERWYRILQEEGVSVWYTAPTAIRMLMKAGMELAKARSFPQLRFIASVGEPLNPEAVWWGIDAFSLAIHDNWWQTETGGIMIANAPAFDIKPGSMGRPLPGVEAGLVRRLQDGSISLVEAPGEEGELALKKGWPSMMRGYLGEAARYRSCFSGEWYLTGDLARRDADGYYWFVGRSDDVIKSAGHLIGPFEVESALLEHPAVAEAGVIGKPHETLGELVKAFVSLRHGFEGSEALRRDILGHARKRLGAAVAPKELDFLPSLPKTRSGKIMRRLLKARELGLPEGDISALEQS